MRRFLRAYSGDRDNTCDPSNQLRMHERIGSLSLFFLKKRFPVSISAGRFQDDTSDDESAFILNYKFRMTIALSFDMNFQIHLHVFVMTNSTKQDQYCIYFVAIYLY